MAKTKTTDVHDAPLLDRLRATQEAAHVHLQRAADMYGQATALPNITAILLALYSPRPDVPASVSTLLSQYDGDWLTANRIISSYAALGTARDRIASTWRLLGRQHALARLATPGEPHHHPLDE